MKDMKLIQILLITVVTSRNINYAISAFANKGTIESERAVTIAAIQGTLVGFVATLAISWLLTSWQSYRRRHKHMDIEMEIADNEVEVEIADNEDEVEIANNEDEVASMEPPSEHDESTSVSSPSTTRSRPRLPASKDYLRKRIDQTPKHERYVYGSDWTNHGERFSLRFSSPAYIKAHPHHHHDQELEDRSINK